MKTTKTTTKTTKTPVSAKKQKQNTDERSLGIASRMREIRTKEGFTQREWSKVIGLSSPAVGAIENSWYLPNIDVLKIIKDKYGYSYDYLLDGKEIKHTNELEEEVKRLKKMVDKLLK